MRPVDLHWPGLDLERATNACGHLEDAALALLAHSYTHRQRYLNHATNHLRMARGYLGAVGFEHKARL